MSQSLDSARPAPPPARSSGWINSADAARVAQVSQASINRWCTDGVLAARKVVGRWRVDRADLDRLLKG